MCNLQRTYIAVDISERKNGFHMTTEFDYLGLHPQIVQAVAERGWLHRPYTNPI